MGSPLRITYDRALIKIHDIFGKSGCIQGTKTSGSKAGDGDWRRVGTNSWYRERILIEEKESSKSLVPLIFFSQRGISTSVRLLHLPRLYNLASRAITKFRYKHSLNPADWKAEK